MQNPFRVAHSLIERIPIHTLFIEGDRIEQRYRCTVAFELDEPVLVAVPVPTGPFGIGGQWGVHRCVLFADEFEASQGVGDFGNPFLRLGLQHRFLVHRIQRRSLLMHGLPSTVKYNECADTGVRDHVSAHSPSLRRRP